ncbi:MAG: phosphoglycerate mutase, partial [Paraprevotella sp.]|nr:phosphoglycerate mutase [Paraprevotella sp.]
NIVHVDGATGLYDTNYEGKAQAAIDALEESDFVYLHVEASDEAGHDGDVALKLKTIEDLDRKIVGPILDAVEGKDVAVAVLPDHPTPCEHRTHTSEPIPFVIYYPGIESDDVLSFDEEAAKKGAYGLLKGDEFIKTFMNN